MTASAPMTGNPGASMRTMRAASITSPRTSSIVAAAPPEPGPSEVCVRLEGCGVCASSIPVWEGREWFTYPRETGAPGHEGWGVVDAVGAAVESVQIGQRVAMLSGHAFAEYDVASVDAIVPIPDVLAERGFPGEPFGCAMNVFARSAIDAGQTVAIIGIGFLGAVLTRLAATVGARVIAISRRSFALDVARQYGAHVRIPMKDHDEIVARVKALTGGEGCDCVIEAIGLQQPLDLAGELTRERGRLVVAGFHQDGPRKVDMFTWNWRGLDVVNAHERDPRVYAEGIRRAVDAIASGTVDPWPLLTHRYPLDELDAAFAASIERPDGFIKAVITT